MLMLLEVAGYSETLEYAYQTTECHIPGNGIHHCYKFKGSLVSNQE